MVDYIMNRESLKRHCEAMCHKFKDVPTSGTYGEHRLVLDLLEQTEWIPVSERLPEDSDYVLCCDKDGYMTIGFIPKWRTKGWIFDDDEVDMDVVAWMPLPQPYKVAREVNNE